MKLYAELDSAITEELQLIDQSKAYQSRLRKTIENFFDGSFSDSEINEVIELVGLEESDDGN